jgi:Uma2 family endonuclease
MASSIQISVHEYLNTSYRPDCDYVDGELRKRNLGELEHALLQSLIAARFLANINEWHVVALVEQRVQVAPVRFRVPDVTVLTRNTPREPIVTGAPLVVVEVLSKDDSLPSMRERVDDYLNFGIEHIWVFDPVARRAYSCSRTGFQEPADGILAVPGTPIRIVLSELFGEAARAL